VFLSAHGVPCVVVERHPDLLIHPRLRGIHERTVEMYRQVGLEPAIRQASFARDEAMVWHAVMAETLASEQFQPVDESDDSDQFAGASPSVFAPIDQDKLEVVLRDRACELGADVQFATELESIDDGGDGVIARLVDRRTGSERHLRADYVVAADGSGSPLRKRLEIGVDGPGPLFQTMTSMITADLTPALRGRRVDIAYLQRPNPGTILLAHDRAGRNWVFGTGYDPRYQSLEDFTDERVADLVRSATGLPDLAVRIYPQIPGTDLKVLGFPLGAQVAQRYAAGRVFLVGDAAHMMPPTGGFGGSTAVHDAHNLAWKLAAVVNGYAGSGLLDTYHDERHPVGLFTMRQALARFRLRMSQGGGGEDDPIAQPAAVTFGYQYRSSAVLGAADDARPLLPAELHGQPGTRAPHMEVTKDGRTISTIDLYGRGLVLLAGPDGDGWMAGAHAAAERLGVPLDRYRFGAELGVPAAAAAHGIGQDGALLVRPDGYVAWRSEGATSDAHGEAERVLRAVLRR
jgi:putative polyketide hydroxylase